MQSKDSVLLKRTTLSMARKRVRHKNRVIMENLESHKKFHAWKKNMEFE